MFIRQLAVIILLTTLGSTIANAQYGIRQCTSVLEGLSGSLRESSAKQTIALERQYLTYCKEHMQSDEYALHLGGLATGLNSDNQHQEAVAVANRCSQINPTDLSCLYEKANALLYLGHLTEARAIIENALTLGAITDLDAAVKPKLRELLAQVPAATTPGPVGRNENVPSRLRAESNSSAKVTGSVSCNGTAVGLSIDIDGEIDARTVEIVSELFKQYHDREAKVETGAAKCDLDRTDFSAFGTHYGINSRGGDVAAAMAIGRMLRKENAWLGVNGVCISACVLILAGAVDRQIGKSDAVGIHRPYFGTTPRRPVTADGKECLRRYVARHPSLSARNECFRTIG
jgi:hypothetical protein